jgi:hypothetical protein
MADFIKMQQKQGISKRLIALIIVPIVNKACWVVQTDGLIIA